MIEENPKYLNCAWCSSQTYLAGIQTRCGLVKYLCPAKHTTFVLEDDTSFPYGYNEEDHN